MLHDPARHEPLSDLPFDAAAARRAIARVVEETEARFRPDAPWPVHPLDADVTDPSFDLYMGASGVVWALQYLAAAGAATLRRDYADYAQALPSRARAWLLERGDPELDTGSYLVGETGARMVVYAIAPDDATLARLDALIARHVDHPSQEFMRGAPGTMAAARFLHARTGEERWADHFRATARRLWSQLETSPAHGCRYWTQDLYGGRYTYLDAVHGFVGNAAPLIQGRALLESDEWDAWWDTIATTVGRTAQREGNGVNWPVFLDPPEGTSGAQKVLMQYCHGAPGFVVCLANAPSPALDNELVAAGEAIWTAGPLAKGSNLCHGTGGNGYAFLKLYQRTGDARWLARARAFAMHGVAQMDSHAAHYGQMRHSLWTGDLGFAIYLWDCVRGAAVFPTVDAFFAA